MSSSETEHESSTPRGARLLRDQILGGNFDRDLVTNQRPGSSDHSGPIRSSVTRIFALAMTRDVQLTLLAPR